jgi:hypothetical protein
MKTSLKQTSLFTEETSTSSQEDSHANPTQWQESEKAKRTNATCGPKCVEQLEKFNHVGSWAKTFSALLIGQEDWYSTRCKLTWKLRGTKYSRMYFQLYPSTLPTEGTEFGLLLTPSTVDIVPDEERLKKRTEYRASVGRQWTPGSLTEQVFHGLLPTPRTVMPVDSEETQIVGNASIRANGKRFGANLEAMAEKGMLPTPATRDYKGARSMEALEEAGRNHTNSLPDFFAQDGQTSQLNPRFVGEMMGFPPNWTELPFLNGEQKV